MRRALGRAGLAGFRRHDQQPARPSGQGQPSGDEEILAGDQAYLLQNTDKRVIFVNPYEGDLALIGTTDIAVEGKPEDAQIDNREIDYLLGVLQRLLPRAAEPRRDRACLLRRAPTL